MISLLLFYCRLVTEKNKVPKLTILSPEEVDLHKEDNKEKLHYLNPVNIYYKIHKEEEIPFS